MLRLAAILLCGCTNAHRVNPGAEAAVWEGMSRQECERIAGRPSIGVYEWRGNSERIYVAAPITPGARILLHEYEHMAEHALVTAGDPNGARVLRHTFRRVCCASWELGRDDLMTEWTP